MSVRKSFILYCIPLCLVLGIIFSAFAGRNADTAVSEQTGRNYKLVFREDFNGIALDTNFWRIIPRNREVEWSAHMSSHPSVFELSHGRMRLYARLNDHLDINDTAKYIVGGIDTKGMVGITYGKVEVRARMTGANGVVSAIWMATTTPKTYPDYMELDLVERISERQEVDQTVHNNYVDKLNILDNPQYQAKPRVKPEKYNVYAVEILPDQVIFSINGKPTLIYPRINTTQIGQYPFGSCEMYLKLNLEAGFNKWLRDIDFTRFPVYMDIDWVKFYSAVL